MAAPTRPPSRPLARAKTPAKTARTVSTTMTKERFKKQLATDLGCSITQAGEIMDQISANLEQTLKQYGRFAWPPFGIYTSKTRNARTGRNPRTGATMQIPKRTTVVLKPSRQLLKALN